MNASADRPSESDPLRSVHTSTFPELLAHLGASLLVTTYQAGKLVILRNDAGVLNTHFRSFNKPMGLAVAGGKLAIGCNHEILEYHNVPAVCARLDVVADHKNVLAGPDVVAGDKNVVAGLPTEPPPTTEGLQNAAGTGDLWSNSRAGSGDPRTTTKHDACFLPRRSHTTGDVQIHEMAWIGDELVFVNTAFSCLAVRSDLNSFEPIWRPRFISVLAPGDNCHLNGLAARESTHPLPSTFNSQPSTISAFATALGATDTPGGWQNKRDGGILIDVESNEIIATGLSMPHSPRWHRNQLWLLESGRGTLGILDLAHGHYEPIVELPGFARGLAMIGPWAFVGLSQVRESAVFSGIPLVERLQERVCGVWVVNIDTGQIAAFCRFEAAVQEVFAVELLPGIRYPDLINDDPELIGRSYVLSDTALREVPQDLRRTAI